MAWTPLDDVAEDRRLGVVVSDYARLRPRYAAAADVLGQVLRALSRDVAPGAVVQVRAKSVASFAEKALRRGPERAATFDDLCGGRVVVPTRAEVSLTAGAVARHLHAPAVDLHVVDDASERLAPDEFGYRSVHLGLRLPPGPVAGVAIPDEVRALRAEVQVRTAAEHVWADFAHDRTYKGDVPLPAAWQRELAGLAATLEAVDDAFTRLDRRLHTFVTNESAYLDDAQMEEQLSGLRRLLEVVPDDVGLVRRAARTARALGHWDVVLETLAAAAWRDGRADLLRERGLALVRTGRLDEGRAALEDAVRLDPADADALSILAGTYKDVDEEQCLELYERAFALRPTEPYAFGNVLEALSMTGALRRVPGLARPTLQAALAVCRERAAVGVDLPWSLLDQGKLLLLSEDDVEGLAAYVDGLAVARTRSAVETSLRSLHRLAPVLGDRPAVVLAREAHALTLALRFGDVAQVESTAATRSGWSPARVLLVTLGGMSPGEPPRALVDAALGGATDDVVDVTVAPLPEVAAPDVGDRLAHLTRLVRFWDDVAATGLAPRDVRVVSTRAAAATGPVRLSRALGARVAVLDDDAPAPDDSREPPREGPLGGTPTASRLPRDVDLVRSFLRSGPAGGDEANEHAPA